VLDRDQRPIASAIPQSLQRMADDDAVTPLTLVEKDAGKSVEVKRGQTVVVRLDSNRSTGYRWTLIEADSSVLTSTGAAVYEERAAGGPVGGSGTETWSFVVAKYGEQQLVFEYRRPWESDLPAARSVSYTVRAVR
jgi:inhibitor of cysteine peptidase